MKTFLIKLTIVLTLVLGFAALVEIGVCQIQAQAKIFDSIYVLSGGCQKVPVPKQQPDVLSPDSRLRS